MPCLRPHGTCALFVFCSCKGLPYEVPSAGACEHNISESVCLNLGSLPRAWPSVDGAGVSPQSHGCFAASRESFSDSGRPPRRRSNHRSCAVNLVFFLKALRSPLIVPSSLHFCARCGFGLYCVLCKMLMSLGPITFLIQVSSSFSESFWLLSSALLFQRPISSLSFFKSSAGW